MKFSGRHFPKDIILQAVRWYITYPLSLRMIKEIFAERGITVDHTTINRWVIVYAPQLEALHRKQKPAVKRSWRMDETYIKIKGRDCYLYRAVDQEGNTVDFLLTKKRDKKAAKAFFRKAIPQHGQPEKVSIDKSGSNISALTSINTTLKDKEPKITIYQSKYLNNIVEQDHRFVKQITRPMMQFKAFYSAKATLAGIEFSHMLRKGQYSDSESTKPWEYFYSLTA
ncbi:IS6 family transposase [Parendozoicomonas sp. Alg238-R29]|uniref:IS6 family transposase n=1 Tax=Parendozoicomonas sp. Alg238-R29 TaxID=2993446 RepID=UPI00248EF739|nr:IS6 family transposase [Parendozoicomonas sp. Alg238-R29]